MHTYPAIFAAAVGTMYPVSSMSFPPSPVQVCTPAIRILEEMGVLKVRH